ncbi:glycoside hydrolase family 93 protein, partial [Amniculicola lignicola CBS 123094]
TSEDGGENWGNQRKAFHPEGRYAGGPEIVNANGTLVVSFMANQDSPEEKNMKAITGTDKGKD